MRVPSCRLGLRGCVVWVLLAATAVMAQVRAQPMAYRGADADGEPTTLTAALRAMAAQAGVIFVGTVTSVRRVEGDGFSAVGVVEVRFAVEAVVRGVSGGSYTLREWGGLLPPGERGFVVGDRRLMLLHSPAATGLSSPVGGFEGAIPVVGTGARVGWSSKGTTAAEPMLDLRWIAARLVRPVQDAEAGEASQAAIADGRERAAAIEEGLPGEERMPARAGGSATARGPTLVHGTLPGVAIRAAPLVAMGSTLPVASVVTLLRQWAGSDGVAH